MAEKTGTATEGDGQTAGVSEIDVYDFPVTCKLLDL